MKGVICVAHKVKCVYCGQTFDRDKEPFVVVNARRYAHYACGTSEEDKRTQEQKDKEELEKYIMDLFHIEYIDARIRKQINQFVEEYHFTYSGIRKALVYHFEVKHNSIDKANGGIGIVPYVYKNAYNYYYALWQAQQKNEDKDVKQYVPVVKEITIPVPERNVKKRKLFAFLDEEVDNNGE